METQDTVIHDGKFVSLRQIETDDYRYEYTVDSRCDGTLVAVLPFFDEHCIVHYELTPCWNVKLPEAPNHMNSITGGWESAKHPTTLDTAIAELREEAGIEADLTRMRSLSVCNLGKSSANIVHLYGYCMSEEEFNNYPTDYWGAGDGSWMEQQEYASLVPIQQALMASTDPLLFVMIARVLAGIYYPLPS